MGSSNSASNAANAEEQRRQAEIRAAQQRIDSIFSSPERERDISDLEAATREFLQLDLDRKHEDAGRNLKFSLARSGLSKGSADTDLNARLGDDYLRGILEAERRAKGAGATLRSQDQDTKTQLFQQILTGLDSTTASQNATRALQQNVDLAKSSALQQGLGDVFGSFSDIFKSSREAAADRRAAFDFNTLYGQRHRVTPTVAGSAIFGGQ